MIATCQADIFVRGFRQKYSGAYFLLGDFGSVGGRQSRACFLSAKKSIKGKRCGLSTALDTLFLMALIINKGKWLLVAFLPLWYNGQRYHPYTGTERGCATMSIFSSFLLSVLASVVAYYICKWLDGDK